MTNTVTLKCYKDGEKYDCNVETKWIGRALAVHRPLKDGRLGIVQKSKCYWAITHLETGFSCGHLNKSVHEVIKLAKAWDEAFSEIHSPEDINDWNLKPEWILQYNGSSPICNPYTLPGIIKRYAN